MSCEVLRVDLCATCHKEKIAETFVFQQLKMIRTHMQGDMSQGHTLVTYTHYIFMCVCTECNFVAATSVSQLQAPAAESVSPLELCVPSFNGFCHKMIEIASFIYSMSNWVE